MKGIVKLSLLVCLYYFGLSAQTSVLPPEYYPMSGVGFSTTLLMVDVNNLPGFEGNVERTGLKKLPSTITLYSAEGITSLNEKWRLGGYTGIGAIHSSDVSSKNEIYVLALTQNNQDTIVSLNPQHFNYNYLHKLSIQMLNVGVLTEYVLSKSSRFEFCIDLTAGGGVMQMNYIQANQSLSWDSLFYSSPVTLEYDKTAGNITSYVSQFYFNESSASAIYFFLQPSFTVNYKLSQRITLRFSPFVYFASIPQGRWKAFGVTTVGDSPEMSLNSGGLKFTLFLLL